MTDTASAYAVPPAAFVAVLAGGEGTRLWPLSRGHRPKQLLRLGGWLTFLDDLREHWRECAKAVTTHGHEQAAGLETVELRPRACDSQPTQQLRVDERHHGPDRQHAPGSGRLASDELGREVAPLGPTA